MNLKDAKTIAASVRLALGNAAKHGGASTDRGLGMRYAAYDIANETYYQMIRTSASASKHWPERENWMQECGFKTATIL